MENSQKSAPKGETKKTEMPSKDVVLEWVKKDLDSAIYLMSFVRHRHPEVLENMAEEIYQKAKREEQGQAIEHITKK